MFRGKKPQGFTIVEVMIFLAVSGLLFVSAATLLAGQQGKTQFSQAIHEIFSQLQSLTNNVQIGYYSNANNFSCQINDTTTGAAPTIVAMPGPGQGSNLGCVFIGQFIQFSPSNNNTQYSLYTVIGRQFQGATGSSPAVTSINQARPTSLTNGATQTITLPAGLQIGSISYNDPNQGGGGPQYTSLFGFISSFAQTQASTQSLQSGAQSVSLIPLPVVIGNSNAGNAYLNISPTGGGSTSTNDINTFFQSNSNPSQIQQNYLGDSGATSSVINPQNGISVCFKSSSTNQIGVVNIGINGNPTGMKLSISDGTCP
jgi:type II secretory pathway pseudopilin PulG